MGIMTVALSYGLSVAIGIAMVHSGNAMALRYRDRLVSRAAATSPILEAFRANRLKTAAALDFGANLTGGTATLLGGYWAPAVYPIVLYRGWIGGIVSVDRRHVSRFATRSGGFYYLVTLLLQLLPYSLTGGAGVNVGIARARPVGDYSGGRLLGVPKQALLDALIIWIIAIPLFAIASAFEFLT